MRQSDDHMKIRVTRLARGGWLRVVGSGVALVLAACWPLFSASGASADRPIASNPAAARAHAARAQLTRSPHSDPARAFVSYEAMRRYFYLPGSGLYRETLGASSDAYLWPFSQALAATVSVSLIRGHPPRISQNLHALLYGLGKYLTETVPAASASSDGLQNLPHFGARIASAQSGPVSYYDDNDWVGIELARVYELTGSQSALSLAEQIMAFEMAGWDSDTDARCPGGIPHSTSPNSTKRSTISTAPAAELALALYETTTQPSYLTFAEQAYQWVRQCTLMPSGMYADNIAPDGELDPQLWSYTQGVMIGAGALLYHATGVQTYLQQSEQTAQTALSYYTLERLAAENPFFVSVFLRNVLYLGSELHDNLGQALAQQYVDWAWNSLRKSNGLFLSATGIPTLLLGQSAMTQLYALLSIPPSRYF
ncbi:MAG: glycoside hydrolase family 76 protein [Solirubrobacteraceae bacterium]